MTAEFLARAAAQGLRRDAVETDRGTRWGCRLEETCTGPRVEPDMDRWETRPAFRLAG